MDSPINVFDLDFDSDILDIAMDGYLDDVFHGSQEEKPDYDIPGNNIQLDLSDEPHAGEDNPDQNALLDMPDKPHVGQDNSDQNALPDMPDESFEIFIQRQISLLQHLNATLEFDPSD